MLCHNGVIASDVIPRRRDRVRIETRAEIKRLAWTQIAQEGADALSLRAVAREMGMTSSALYRYFESKEQLLDALAVEAFGSLADTLEEVERRAHDDELEAGPRFMAITCAYRQWAVEHPTEYRLMFGVPVADLDDRNEATKAEMYRGVAVLTRCMAVGVAEGSIQPAPLAIAQAERLAGRLQMWSDRDDLHLPAEALAACMFTWTQLHGAISLELFSHLPTPVYPADDLFEYLMGEVLRALGVHPRL
ncbi:MAG TPA: TetR/AcrR family transcriptional regulator [Acidimicrobiales bacterium]|jgi:AcrR family transcriptional regulator|nr:TetR/AcrR family transcriptional regulator [Acidimicrobiales bacterium]